MIKLSALGTSSSVFGFLICYASFVQIRVRHPTPLLKVLVKDLPQNINWLRNRECCAAQLQVLLQPYRNKCGNRQVQKGNAGNNPGGVRDGRGAVPSGLPGQPRTYSRCLEKSKSRKIGAL
jgi:hypothetical protein